VWINARSHGPSDPQFLPILTTFHRDTRGSFPCNCPVLPIKVVFSNNCPREAGVGRVKFNLIDKIEQLTEERIVGVKYVSLAEEYLADHFPTFPVLPGVMMLEAAVQAAGWLLHHRTQFGRSMAVLKEARNVKYGHFVAPGNFLRMEVDFMKTTDSGATFKATGITGSAQAVQMRIELAYFNLADKNPELAAIDARIAEHNRQRWELLRTHSRNLNLPAQTA
jgi:3-hydroxyacyl-[acyl-carrier-protein] dehydratase